MAPGQPASLDREGLAATARAFDVGVVELEARAGQAVRINQVASIQEEERLFVDKDAETVELEELVALFGAVHDRHLVHEAGAPAADHANAQSGLVHVSVLGRNQGVPALGCCGVYGDGGHFLNGTIRGPFGHLPR